MDWIREEEEYDMLERFYREIVEVAIFPWMGPWQLAIRIGYVGYIHYYYFFLGFSDAGRQRQLPLVWALLLTVRNASPRG
jgi:hypothetical protein